MASPQTQVDYPQSYRDEFIGYRLTNTAIAFIILETVFVFLRIWSRKFSRAPFGWEDVLVFSGLVFCIGLSVACILSVKYGGVGHHFVALPPNKTVIGVKTSLIAGPVLYSVSVSLPKLAILILYLKIFRAKWSRIGCYVVGAVLVLTPLVNIPTIIWQCTPVDHLWDPESSPNGHCFNLKAHFLYGSLPNIITDVALLLLPIPTIWILQTELKVKIGIYLTFLTGGIGLITSIIRFRVFFQSEADESWVGVPLQIWNIIEPGVYLIASCLIACRPLASYLIYESLLSTIFTRSGQISQTVSRKPQNQHSGTHRVGSRIELVSNDDHSDKHNLFLGKKFSSQPDFADPYRLEDV